MQMSNNSKNYLNTGKDTKLSKMYSGHCPLGLWLPQGPGLHNLLGQLLSASDQPYRKKKGGFWWALYKFKR